MARRRAARLTRYGSPVRAVAPVLVASAIVSCAASASANGRFPASNRIVFAPGDANLVAVRTTYGILLSHDDGDTWSFLCEDALGLPPSAVQDPPLTLSGSSTLIVGTAVPFAGLDVSSDTGCNWTCAGGALAGQTVVDLTVRPDVAHHVLALTSTFVFAAADAGADASDAGTTARSLSQVFESADDGATWAPLGVALDPTVLPTSLEVASGDPGRVYVSATRGFGAARTASLFVSDDGGTTWVERPVPLDGSRGETSVYIGAVDPMDADRVYLRTDGQSSQLFVTANAGQSFATALSLTGKMLGLALSADGATVYAGSAEDGLFAGARGDATLLLRSSVHVQCLATRGDELWACSDDQSTGFVAGSSIDDGATFVPKLHLGSVSAPIACAPSGAAACTADANAAQCTGVPFAQLCADLGCTDAGAPSGPARTSSSCRCQAVGGADRAPGAIAVVWVAMAACIHRRTRPRSPR
jgi:photosystem II stability/assembly factor-like uncharacterized protein